MPGHKKTKPATAENGKPASLKRRHLVMDSQASLVSDKDRDVAAEFDTYFGSASKLENWQRLCADIGLEGDFGSLTKCRRALRKVFVNIHDLLDAISANPPQKPYIFPSHRKLVIYTLWTRRIFPKAEAKDHGGPVRDLLRHIFRGARKAVHNLKGEVPCCVWVARGEPQVCLCHDEWPEPEVDDGWHGPGPFRYRACDEIEVEAERTLLGEPRLPWSLQAQKGGDTSDNEDEEKSEIDNEAWPRRVEEDSSSSENSSEEEVESDTNDDLEYEQAQDQDSSSDDEGDYELIRTPSFSSGSEISQGESERLEEEFGRLDLENPSGEGEGATRTD
ncbi:hypothetical protein QBC35DRAFT_102937 [Podospora australis]|uniref:Uncharacterized protein n=1 Tax=Podospora australis TaxID=1536484 RepID=A0AAN6X470_9PEZI|nr:hypothetical protein QBC35DRAFT_102937 [Podospora australis]